MGEALKRSLLIAGSILAGLSIYYSTVTKQYIEILRDLGMYYDTYNGLSSEEVKSKIKNPNDVRDYLIRHLRQGCGPFTSFEAINSKKSTNCEGAALVAKTLIDGLNTNEQRYECRRIMLESENFRKPYHVVALVKDKKTRKFGALGINARDCTGIKYSCLEKAISAVNKNCLGIFDNFKFIDDWHD